MLRLLKYFLWILAGGMIFFLVLNLIFPLRFTISYSPQVLSSDGKVLHAFLSKDEKWRMQATLPEINGKLRKAFIFKEDKYFYYHPGVNPFAVLRAAFNNIIYHKKTSGASTITMQVVRLIFPSKRTYLNKIIEAFRAFQLECRFSKDEILQLYLNLVPYGSNIEGVKSATVLYFGTVPEKLSLAQIVTLTVVPNQPVSLSLNKRNKKTVDARNKWLRRMEDEKIFDSVEVNDAYNEPLLTKRVPSPKQIPHLAIRLRNQYPDSSIFCTNIVTAIQEKAEHIASNYIKRFYAKNIFNGTVLVIDNKTRNVIAYVGSNDYNDALHAGQVDGVVAVRSPGSTLKSLVYALAFDMGYITPHSAISDVPVNYLGYAPENFNSTFNGKVTVEKALATSLNIPAVKMLNRVSVPVFVDKLTQAGFGQIKKDRKKLGLSTVLGGCGVRLEELTNLYATFANNGAYMPLNYLKDNINDTVAVQIISPAAAYMTTDILSQLIRPDLPNNYQSNYHIPKVAWKTGTSYGRRDAWSIGYNSNFTIGVWVGNFSGQGIPELTGADMATPLLFELFNSIDYNSCNNWFIPPSDLSFRLVCSESGKIPSEFCKHLVTDYFIPLVSSVAKCNHVKEVFIAADEKTSYCLACIPPNNYKKKLFPNLDPDLKAWYDAEHVAYDKMPPHNPMCTKISSGNAPQITSPLNKNEYLVEKNGEDKLMLSCATTSDIADVYWYIDDLFYASAKTSEQLFFTPHPGSVKISCADDKGRNSNIWITVKNY